jgi:hypothetical protein
MAVPPLKEPPGTLAEVAALGGNLARRNPRAVVSITANRVSSAWPPLSRRCYRNPLS